GAGHPVTFHDVELSAVKVSGLVQPELIGQRNNVGNQRVSLPPITCVPHPPVRTVEVRPSVWMKDAECVIVLVDNRKVPRALENLKGSGKIGRTGNTCLITLNR